MGHYPPAFTASSANRSYWVAVSRTFLARNGHSPVGVVDAQVPKHEGSRGIHPLRRKVV